MKADEVVLKTKVPTPGDTVEVLRDDGGWERVKVVGSVMVAGQRLPQTVTIMFDDGSHSSFLLDDITWRRP